MCSAATSSPKTRSATEARLWRTIIFTIWCSSTCATWKRRGTSICISTCLSTSIRRASYGRRMSKITLSRRRCFVTFVIWGSRSASARKRGCSIITRRTYTGTRITSRPLRRRRSWISAWSPARLASRFETGGPARIVTFSSASVAASVIKRFLIHIWFV